MLECKGQNIVVKGTLLKIARPDLDKTDAPVDPSAMIDALRMRRQRIDLFTFMQVMPEIEPKYDYYMEQENLAILTVSTFENWWNNQIRSYPRNRARQAEKRGVMIREIPFDDELVRGIWGVYNESMVRQGKANRHYGKNIEQVRRESATYLERSVFIGAYFENELIGFVKLVINRDGRQACLMNIVAMMRHRDKAPTNALIAHAVRACAERKIPYLMYFNFVYGNKGADSLTHFKEINGFDRVDLPRYYVPLTRWGQLALKLGLHKRLLDRIPEPVIVKFRSLRSRFYERLSRRKKAGEEVPL